MSSKRYAKIGFPDCSGRVAASRVATYLRQLILVFGSSLMQASRSDDVYEASAWAGFWTMDQAEARGLLRMGHGAMRRFT